MIRYIQYTSIVILAIFAILLLLSNEATPAFPPAFALKRAQEKFFLNFKTTPQAKIEYYDNLLDNRFKELKSLIEKKQDRYFLLSSLRYSTTVGELTNLIKENNLKEEVEEVKEKLINQQKALRDLLNKYQDENGEWKYIIDDINYLQIYLEQLSDGS